MSSKKLDGNPPTKEVFPLTLGENVYGNEVRYANLKRTFYFLNCGWDKRPLDPFRTAFPGEIPPGTVLKAEPVQVSINAYRLYSSYLDNKNPRFYDACVQEMGL